MDYAIPVVEGVAWMHIPDLHACVDNFAALVVDEHQVSVFLYCGKSFGEDPSACVCCWQDDLACEPV
jgi:hypothetical protein